MVSQLHRELLGAYCLAREPAVAQGLRDIGVAPPAWPLWGIGAVSAGPRHYQPDPDGTCALIAGAYEDGALVDLVATSVTSLAMRCRRGDARLLGFDIIERAREHDCPLIVFDNACAWARHRGLGVVIVDWNRGPELLRDVPRLLCKSPAMALRLKRAFERPRPYPEILVPQQSKESRHVA